MKRLILFFCALSLSVAHRTYRDRLPNGYNVPNPCKPGTIWEAVGHNDPLNGSHQHNPFGEDFKHRAGKHWTTELCQMDSDGDGVSNGAELGDPDCKWTQGATPAGPATGHPGICEPVDSPNCQSQSVC